MATPMLTIRPLLGASGKFRGTCAPHLPHWQLIPRIQGRQRSSFAACRLYPTYVPLRQHTLF